MSIRIHICAGNAFKLCTRVRRENRAEPCEWMNKNTVPCLICAPDFILHTRPLRGRRARTHFPILHTQSNLCRGCARKASEQCGTALVCACWPKLILHTQSACCGSTWAAAVFILHTHTFLHRMCRKKCESPGNDEELQNLACQFPQSFHL